jgi:hypothetical protein
MLTSFAELSRGQQKYVVILAQYRPNRDRSGEVTSAFVRELHHELLALRETGGPKVGWPRWVFVENLIRKSVGFVPFATSDEIEAFNVVPEKKTEAPQIKTLQPVETPVKLQLPRLLTNAEYESELIKAGILKGTYYDSR